MFKQMNKPLEKNSHLFTFKSVRIPIIYAIQKRVVFTWHLQATDLLTPLDISQQDVRGNVGSKTPFITARRELWGARVIMGDKPQNLFNKAAM